MTRHKSEVTDPEGGSIKGVYMDEYFDLRIFGITQKTIKGLTKVNLCFI